MFAKTCIEYLDSLIANEARLSVEGVKLLGWLRRRYPNWDVALDLGDRQVVRIRRKS